VLVLAAVPDQLHQVGVPELPQEDHLCLHNKTTRTGHISVREQRPSFPSLLLGSSPDSIRPPAGCRNCHIAQQT
jgi:hypothetical protein